MMQSLAKDCLRFSRHELMMGLENRKYLAQFQE